MIADIARQAWAESPARVIAAILAAPAVLVLVWALLVVLIVGLTPTPPPT